MPIKSVTRCILELVIVPSDKVVDTDLWAVPLSPHYHVITSKMFSQWEDDGPGVDNSSYCPTKRNKIRLSITLFQQNLVILLLGQAIHSRVYWNKINGIKAFVKNLVTLCACG